MYTLLLRIRYNKRMNKHLQQFQDEIVLVTGASRGIGLATAQAFARNGARVMMNYHQSKTQAEAACAALRAEGCDAAIFPADIGDSAAVEAMFAEIELLWGEVSILVNNAGIDLQALVTDTTETDFDQVLQTNLKGPFLCTRRALPAMLRKRAGNILYIGSVFGSSGAANESIYAASKGALVAFTRSLAAEVGSCGIRVNLIAPGAICTDMLNAELDNEEQGLLAQNIALQRLGNPEEIATACLFLASPAAAYVQGQILTIDGGWLS